MLADVDGDGDEDVIVGDDSQDEVYLFTAPVPNASVTSSAATATFSSSGALGRFMREGDMDGDGSEDLLLSTNSSPIGIDCRSAEHSGIFAVLQPVTPGSRPPPGSDHHHQAVPSVLPAA